MTSSSFLTDGGTNPPQIDVDLLKIPSIHHENYDVAEVIPEELSFDDSVPNFGPKTFG